VQLLATFFSWDEVGKLVNSGDIIRMSKGYANIWKNCLTLYMSKASEFFKTGEFCLVFSETPFMRFGHRFTFET
jgi:hypothetical protein